MMDLRTIRDMADQAARKARRDGREPYGFFDESEVDRVEHGGRAPLPFLGSYVPKGYRLVETYFVDSSGFGSENEPALTQRAFFERVRGHVRDGNPYFYAVTEAGQFQCYVGVFERRPERDRRRLKRAHVLRRAPRVQVPVIG